MPRPKPPANRVRVQVTITLPKELLRQVDAIAAREDRHRSKVVEILMRERIEERKAA